MSTPPNFSCNDSTLQLFITDPNVNEGMVGNLNAKFGYYFKLRVYNALGKFRESFEYYLKTKNAPPVPVNFYGAFNITENSVLLKWQKCTDPEFSYYSLHGDSSLTFTPSLRNKLVFSIKPKIQLI